MFKKIFIVIILLFVWSCTDDVPKPIPLPSTPTQEVRAPQDYIPKEIIKYSSEEIGQQQVYVMDLARKCRTGDPQACNDRITEEVKLRKMLGNRRE